MFLFHQASFNHREKIGMFVIMSEKKNVRQPASNLPLFASPLRLFVYEVSRSKQAN